MSFALVIALILALVAGYFFSRGSRMAPLFTDAHLQQILRGLAQLKTDGLQAKPGEPAALVTSAPMLISYSAAKTDEGMTEHHVSISTPLTPAAAAGTYFLALVEWGLALPGATRAAVFSSQRRVFHLVHVMSPEAHEAWAEAPVAPDADLAAARQAAISGRKALQARFHERKIELPADPASP